MKLYMHPVSTTSRPVMMFIAENGIDCELQVVDLLSGEHLTPDYAAINPHKLVPVLEDGDLILNESSAILKYLADTANAPAYPKDLKQRARINAAMDWFNADFYRDFAYGLVYPPIFPTHKRPSDEAQSATVQWALDKTKERLPVLDDRMIGPNQGYLCGNEISIADYLGVEFLGLGNVIGCDFSAYPNISRWVGNMHKLKSWDSVHEVINGFTASLKGQSFTTI
jgi:glutathione S-transferase